MKDSILYRLKNNYDLKRLSNKELVLLSDEIRNFLVEKISKTGGHLASNLGVVELTLSLLKVFNIDEDKIIWDVGHQSYVYKMLTGRLDEFDTLRQLNGLSGFPKCCESKYDAFNTGHSSTSISAALGMARARDILGKNNNIIAVIGDGALTGGMALEALNDVGYNKTKMIIILNDNEMSIAENVGGLSTYLSKLRMGTGYNKIKAEINDTLNLTNIGKSVASSIDKVKDSIKQLVMPNMLFEDMGLKYIGPIDGHNIKDLCEVLFRVKNYDGPVIIHTITQKGKGYKFAEENSSKFHSIAPFNPKNGECLSNSKSTTFSSEFGKSIISEAENNEKVVAITAAMPSGTGLNEFAEKFPNRFFDVGIAEQHAVTLAAGMAKGGLKPVFAVYSTFLQRGFDQVLHDVCLQNIPVVFAIDRAGIVGADGETHQGIFDISYLGLMPNIKIVSPKCTEELKIYLNWALKQNNPVAIRYPRGGDLRGIDLNPISNIEDESWEIVKDGQKVAVIATGKMVQHAMLAKDIIGKENSEINFKIINANFIKPIDYKMIDKLCTEGYKIITIEDNILQGGMGSMILNYMCNKKYKNDIVLLGYNKKIIPQGDVDSLYDIYGLSPKKIAETVMSFYNKEFCNG